MKVLSFKQVMLNCIKINYFEATCCKA